MKTKGSRWSVVGLVTSHTIKPVLILGFLLCLVQGIQFYYLGMMQASNPRAMYQWIDYGIVVFSFVVVFLITVVLGGNAAGGSAKSQYTMNRLGVSRKKLCAIWMGNTCAIVLIIWGLQFLILWLACQYYEVVSEVGTVTVQSILLSSYRSNFFHFIMPVADVTGWIRNLAFLFYVSAESAAKGMKHLKGEKGGVYITFIFLAAFIVKNDSEFMNIFLTIILVGAGISLVRGGLTDEA